MIHNLIKPKYITYASDWEYKLCSVRISLFLAIETWHNRMSYITLEHILFDPNQC